MKTGSRTGGVTIGDVTGGIHGSIVAGRDVGKATILLGGEETSAAKEPAVAELKKLLAEIQEELAQVTADPDILRKVSPAALHTAQEAEASIRDVAARLEESTEVKPTQAKSMRGKLGEAVTQLSGILDRAKTVAQKANDAIDVIQPLVGKLGPLVQKVAVAALWVGKLWLRV